MFPIRDTIPSRRTPIVNYLLIGINVLIFIFEISLGPAGLERVIRIFGMVPARYDFGNLAALLNHPILLLSLISSIFLHGGWLHLISNMWTLFIFGDNVEDRLGSGRYLIFYLLAGIVANLLQAFLFQGSSIPTVGASGAIAGVLGAYFLSYPRARVLTLIPLFIFPWFLEIPAIIYLGFWFVSQLYSGVFALGMPQGASMGGIAWWAHIGGFIFGLLLVGVFAWRPNRRDEYPAVPW